MFKQSRFENQRLAQERKKELLKQMLARGQKKDGEPDLEPAKPAVETLAPPAPLRAAETEPSSPYLAASFGNARIAVFSRDYPEIQLRAEPWLKSLVAVLLDASVKRGIHICLTWPGRLASLPLAHALASLERLAIGDFIGLRSLIYPVKQTTFYSLHHLVLDRKRLVEICQTYLTIATPGGERKPLRPLASKEYLLMALSTILSHEPTTPLPTIAELIPSFTYQPDSKNWGTYNDGFLRRSLSKLRLSHRQQLRASFSASLGRPESAPDSLLGIPYGTNKGIWAEVLSSKILIERDQNPDLLLLDATEDMQRTSFRSVNRIPAFIGSVIEKLGTSPGAVVYTDNPATFFSLRKRVRDELGLDATTHVFTAEGDGLGLSIAPRPDGFIPVQRNIRHYPIEILDREATGVALKFSTAAQNLPTDSPAQVACLDACHYLLRISNLPGGYRDLGEWLEEERRPSSMIRRLSWPGYEAQLTALSQQGQAGTEHERIRQAIDAVHKLIDAWTDATPMALRLARELATYADKPKKKVAVVFPKSAYIAVARRFLHRHFAETKTPFTTFEERVVFINHKELKAFLGATQDLDHLIFVGLNDETLRVMLTDERVSAGSVVLISYKQADNYLKALLALKSIEELKPYRGRISGMVTELEKKLRLMPSPLPLDRLQLRALTLSFESSADAPDGGDQAFWKLDLENVGRIYVARRVYKYCPELDPPFDSATVDSVNEGDSIFVMTDDLRDLVEATIREAGFKQFGRGITFATMLDTYHGEVRRRSEELFPAKSKRECAQKIRSRMVELNASAVDCSLARVLYWLDLDDSQGGESKTPHAARDHKSFETFARALGIPEGLFKDFWLYAINITRKESRMAGRELADFYTNVLFHPENIRVYAKLRPETIAHLQHEAARNVFKVIRKIAPELIDK